VLLLLEDAITHKLTSEVSNSFLMLSVVLQTYEQRFEKLRLSHESMKRWTSTHLLVVAAAGVGNILWLNHLRSNAIAALRNSSLV
jgi:hypothetical protein